MGLELFWPGIVKEAFVFRNFAFFFFCHFDFSFFNHVCKLLRTQRATQAKYRNNQKTINDVLCFYGGESGDCTKRKKKWANKHIKCAPKNVKLGKKKCEKCS